MPERILTPLDGTAVAEAGLAWARHTADRCHAALHLLTVVEGPAKGAVSAAKRYLERHRDGLAAEGLSVSVEVAIGSPAELIVQSAAQVQLTVMTYGTSRWLFGQALDAVMRAGSGPLVVVRARPNGGGAIAANGIGHDGGKILIPVDLSSRSQQVLPPALALAKDLGASVIFCHVIAPVGPHHDPALAPPGVARVIEGLVEEARLALATAAARARHAGLAAEIVVAVGQPFAEIARLAERCQATLIAMATRGNHSLSRVLGSVAFSVAQHGRVPCLLVPCPETN